VLEVMKEELVAADWKDVGNSSSKSAVGRIRRISGEIRLGHVTGGYGNVRRPSVCGSGQATHIYTYTIQWKRAFNRAAINSNTFGREMDGNKLGNVTR
jgi:hypothetical protein